MLIKAGNIVTAHIVPVDAYGNPAKIDGLPVWTLSDPLAITAETIDDTGTKATLSSLGPVGSVTLTVTVDADLGEGIKTLTGQLVLDIEAGEAVDVGFHIEPPVIIEVI